MFSLWQSFRSRLQSTRTTAAFAPSPLPMPTASSRYEPFATRQKKRNSTKACKILYRNFQPNELRKATANCTYASNFLRLPATTRRSKKTRIRNAFLRHQSSGQLLKSAPCQDLAEQAAQWLFIPAASTPAEKPIAHQSRAEI